MNTHEISELCLRKLHELGKEYLAERAFFNIFSGPYDEKSILDFLTKTEERIADKLSLKIKRILVTNEELTLSPSEKFFLSLRLVCAQSNLPRLRERSLTGSPLVLQLQTNQTNEALLWAATNFWEFYKQNFLPMCSKVYASYRIRTGDSTSQGS